MIAIHGYNLQMMLWHQDLHLPQCAQSTGHILEIQSIQNAHHPLLV